jgi:hypothetical protein
MLTPLIFLIFNSEFWFRRDIDQRRHVERRSMKNHKRYFLVALVAGAIAFSPQAIANNLTPVFQEKISSHVVASGDQLSTSDIVARLRKPTTPTEILLNTKFTWEHRLLSRKDFLTRENIMNVFGGTQFTEEKGDHEKVEISISDFGGMVKPVKYGPNIFYGINLELFFAVNDNGAIKESLHLFANRRGVLPNFKFMEQLFGSNWRYTNPHLSHKAISRHENDKIMYHIENGRTRDDIYEGFDQKARLQDIFFSFEEDAPPTKKQQPTPTINLEDKMSTKDIVDNLKKPTTPLDILLNLKYAWEHRLLSRDDFFTEENLINTFGGKKFFGLNSDQKNKYVSITGFDAIVEPVKNGSNLFPGVEIALTRDIENDLGQQVEGNGKFVERLWLHMQRADMALDFGYLEKLFGTDWQYANIPISPHRIMPTPTKAHGNDQIVFGRKNGDIRTGIYMEFNADATLDQITLTTEQ